MKNPFFEAKVAAVPEDLFIPTEHE